jgi:NhaA family Na+:H+ antiporter
MRTTLNDSRSFKDDRSRPRELSLLLLVGTAVAVLRANLDFDSYDAVAHPLHFWVNEIGMVFFFALAVKEVFEATLPGVSLASARQALAPLAAAVGGMVGPALIFVALASVYGPAEHVRGWAIPCATDIAFSAMVARLIFPSTHPAIPFLLLLAIADDALGLVILALFYPRLGLKPTTLESQMSRLGIARNKPDGPGRGRVVSAPRRTAS